MSHWYLIGVFCAFCFFVNSVCGTSPAPAYYSDSYSNKLVSIYCVTVSAEYNSDGDSSCGEYDPVERHTLAFYMNNHSEYFKSYQTYVFQRGAHVPLADFKLKIKNVTNLTFTGAEVESSTSEAAVINCNGSITSFEFFNISYATIKELTFYGCVTMPSKYKIGHSVLFFAGGFHLTLLRLRMLMSVDEAFFIEDVYGEIVLHSVDIKDSNTGGKAVHDAGNSIRYRKCRNKTKTSVSIINSSFVNNSNLIYPFRDIDAGGLTINLRCSNIEVRIESVSMTNNKGGDGGNLALFFESTRIYYNTSVTIINSHFDNGNATVGGGMVMSFIESSDVEQKLCSPEIKTHTLLYVYNSTFSNNTAKYAGGGVYLRQKQSLTLCNSQTIKLANVTFMKNLIVRENAGFGGIAVHSINFMVTDYLHHLYPQFHVVLENCSIHGNRVDYNIGDGSGMGAVFTKSNNNFQLKNTAIYNNTATGVLGMSSNIILSGNITIVNNSGSSGGGMLLCQNAVMYLDKHTNVTIAHNTANHAGGGICVETDYLQSKPICFYQFARDPLINPDHAKTVNVSVYNNRALLAGNNIFGGSIEHCYMIDSPKHKANRSTDIYDAVFNVPKNEDLPSSVTSSPHHICFCLKNNTPNCSVTSYKYHQPIFPGESISVYAVLVGQYNGAVPGTIQAKLSSSNFSFAPTQDVQDITKVSCTCLKYTINSSKKRETLSFQVQHTGDISGFEKFWESQKYSINITMKKCPMGFSLIRSTTNVNGPYCSCSPFLRNINSHINCKIKTQAIQRSPPSWVGYVETSNGSKILAYHSNCPIDYCKHEVIPLNVTKDSLSQNDQCAYNRIGTLCGSCGPGLSVIMASSECLSCSNKWLTLYIVYALSGILALIALTLFNITIAEGTMSGVVFYCNIVGSNMAAFFPSGQHVTVLTPVVTFFVSLINMESGIPHCHFNGMDAYAVSWLNFCFPFYIWFISGLLIFLGNRFSWIVRHNAVKVLATLILLSYARLLSAVMDALQIRFIILESGGYDKRWLMDGNIKYFEGKHIYLVIFALLLCLLLLPFTFCLVFIQCLQSASHYRGLSWINKLKPFFDAYTGPFTSKARSWTGLLLLSRGIVCIISAINTTGDPKWILGTISLLVTLLLVFVSLLPAGLYRRRCLNTLEYISLLNLGVLTSLLYIFSNNNIFSIVIPHICVSITLLVSLGIVIYHITSLPTIKSFIRESACYRRVLKLRKKRNNSTSDYFEIDTDNFPPYEPFNEEREPLLGNSNNN